MAAAAALRQKDILKTNNTGAGGFGLERHLLNERNDVLGQLLCVYYGCVCGVVQYRHPYLSSIAVCSRLAQWKRAGPITQRSVDRNHGLLIVFYFFKMNI